MVKTKGPNVRKMLARGVLSGALLGLALPASGQAVKASESPPIVRDGATGGEIVVTATRRAEALSKISQSVTAFNEKSLDVRGVKGIADITRLTPGIELNANGFGTQSDISIRGISSQVGSATTGIYIDETPIQTRIVGYSATNTYPLVFDLERVEVLRGPQGTLFGAGSEGGTIRFITPQPSLTRYSAYGRAEISGTKGGDASYEAGVAVGGPIAPDKLGFRISVWERREGGYVDRKNLNPELGGSGAVDKNANRGDTLVARLAVVAAPATHLTITPSLFIQDRRLHDIGTYWEGAASGAGRFVNGQPLAQPDHDRFILPALNIQYDFPGVTLISNTSLYQRKDRLIDDYSTLIPAIFSPPLNFVPGDTGYAAHALMINKQSVWTEELRLQSSNPKSALTWTVGLFLSESRQKADEDIIDPAFGEVLGAPPEVVLGLPLIDGIYSLKARTEGIDRQGAIFGEASYHVTDKLKLTAGLRVARASFTGEGYATGPFVGDTVIQPLSKTSETPVTPKAAVSYQMNDDNLFYASAAKGYRIGGTNAPLSAFCNTAAQGYGQAPTNYQSDNVWSYEIGAKNKLFDRRLEVSTSVYRIDWRNIQQLVYVSNCGQQFVDNLGQATSKGFDVQLVAHPVKGLTVEASVGYTDSTFSKSVNKQPGAAPNVVTRDDHIDTQPWSGTLGVTYDAEIASDYNAFVRVDYSYHSASALTALRDPANGGFDGSALPTPATSFLSLRGGLRWSRYDISMFVDNVTNAHPNLTRYSEVLGNLVHRDFTFRPLTVGITAAYRY